MKTNHDQPLIRRFADAEPYDQPEPGDAAFAWLLKRGELGQLQIGHVRLTGPIHKTPAIHQAFDQVYLVLRGRAVVHVGDDDIAIDGQTVVTIPHDTHHSIEVAAGDEVEYVFVNGHLEGQAG